MHKIALEVSGQSSGVYRLMKIIANGICENQYRGKLYEIHILDSNFISVNKVSESFIERTKEYYSAFVDPSYTDLYPCDNINYVYFDSKTIYCLENVGANYYIGTGAQATIDMRKFCFENNLQMIYDEADGRLGKWLDEKKHQQISKSKKAQIKFLNEGVVKLNFRNNLGKDQFTAIVKQANLQFEIFQDESSLDKFFEYIFSDKLTEVNGHVMLKCETIFFNWFLELISKKWLSNFNRKEFAQYVPVYSKYKNSSRLTEKTLSKKPKNFDDRYTELEKLLK